MTSPTDRANVKAILVLTVGEDTTTYQTDASSSGDPRRAMCSAVRTAGNDALTNIFHRNDKSGPTAVKAVLSFAVTDGDLAHTFEMAMSTSGGPQDVSASAVRTVVDDAVDYINARPKGKTGARPSKYGENYDKAKALLDGLAT